MTLIEKIEKKAEQQESYPTEYNLQLAYKYGFVTSELEYRINKLEIAYKELEKTIKEVIK